MIIKVIEAFSSSIYVLFMVIYTLVSCIMRNDVGYHVLLADFCFEKEKIK